MRALHALHVVVAPTAISFVMPVRVVSEANARDGWRAKAKRAQGQRATAKMMARSFASTWLRHVSATALTVTLVRHGPRVMDMDNCQSSLKACRDGIADFLGVNDNDPRVQWDYEQRVSDVYGVEVRLQTREM